MGIGRRPEIVSHQIASGGSYENLCTERNYDEISVISPKNKRRVAD